MSKPKQTKIEMVRALLAQPKGASLAAICSATGWQPHSARAALSGLRKAGYAVERTATEEGTTGSAVYRIIATPGSAT
ncbi:DUF3489 domain-containing protein [Roseicyclus marinus]|uniref:DUF3489 domain-containing protein n=1 Tax=Roseicyclus marinus TaxID=2161673 RepID=A0AA48HI62_9RHOB|nr:hypothetical protein MACH21_08130 [Roseicyclus marinus]